MYTKPPRLSNIDHILTKRTHVITDHVPSQEFTKLWAQTTWRRNHQIMWNTLQTHNLISAIGVGTVGATGALAPAMQKPWGRKYLFAPAIIYQVYLLVDSQTSISLYSFKILNLNLIKFRVFSTGYMFLNELCEAYNCLNHTPIHRGLQESSHKNTKCTKNLGCKGFAPDLIYSAPANP